MKNNIQDLCDELLTNSEEAQRIARKYVDDNNLYNDQNLNEDFEDEDIDTDDNVKPKREVMKAILDSIHPFYD